MHGLGWKDGDGRLNFVADADKAVQNAGVLNLVSQQ